MAEPDAPAPDPAAESGPESGPEYVIDGYDVEVSERIALLPAGPAAEAPPVRVPVHG